MSALADTFRFQLPRLAPTANCSVVYVEQFRGVVYGDVIRHTRLRGAL